MVSKPLIVQKFGGTSMGTIENIHTVAKHIISAKKSGNQLVVVVSAMSGETNRLMALAKQVDNVPTARELDVLLSAGEQMSMALLAMTLNKLGYPAVSLTGSQANIMTDNRHNDAEIQRIDTTRIYDLLALDKIVIVAGFQGVNTAGDITTLGRGGSDTTAVVLAGALSAAECQIFTDVDGVYTIDPRIVPTAQKLAVIDFPSMASMAQHGAKVLHLPSVHYAWTHQVPLRVLSTFDASPGEVCSGTLVKGNDCHQAICGFAIQSDMCLISMKRTALADVQKQCQMLGIMIWNVIERPEWVAIVIKQDVYTKLELVIESKISNSEPIGLVTAVGVQAEQLAKGCHQRLAEQGITVIDTVLNPLSITFVISPDSIDKAANILHHAYINSSDVANSQQKCIVVETI